MLTYSYIIILMLYNIYVIILLYKFYIFAYAISILCVICITYLLTFSIVQSQIIWDKKEKVTFSC